ncbi:hypothetical protein [Bradyrhizobium sp. OAE829]|uniref:hypothetical protein n=1 Tax=Bradyrhizobium sp. OAE829 TaxID=2663807 RepID=UPI001789E5D4
MLRWMTPFLVAIFAIGTAAADEGPGAAKATDGTAAAKPADSPAATTSPKSPAVAKRANNLAAAKRAAVRATKQLPPGLPRAHYNYRTTVAPATAPLYVRRGRQLVVVEEADPDVLFTPVGVVPYAPRVYGVPLLPGSNTLPGYYGTSHSYSYDGPYYGGPYTPYWSRLPYAGGVYGYR